MARLKKRQLKSKSAMKDHCKGSLTFARSPRRGEGGWRALNNEKETYGLA